MALERPVLDPGDGYVGIGCAVSSPHASLKIPEVRKAMQALGRRVPGEG